MATNVYFSNFKNSAEQSLIEDLIIESIKIYGLNMWYIPRTLVAKDELLNEDDLSTFSNASLIEMYIKNVDSFDGEGDFLSKFGLQIRDSMVLTVARRIFELEVPDSIRPNEGDLIYFPLNGKIWELKHVEHESIHYQMGDLQVYDLNVELFEYSGERFATGINDIDTRYDDYDLTSNTAYANVESVDSWADNATIEAEGNKIIDFSVNNPFGDEDY